MFTINYRLFQFSSVAAMSSVKSKEPLVTNLSSRVSLLSAAGNSYLLSFRATPPFASVNLQCLVNRDTSV